MKSVRFWLTAAVLSAGMVGAVQLLSDHPGGERPGLLHPVAWQRMASPGALAKAHQFLEHDCAACHVPLQGAVASACITCHANNESLLQRQPTAFHAWIGTCRECHPDHRGSARPPAAMDHAALALIGLRREESRKKGEEGRANPVLSNLARRKRDKDALPHPHVSELEAALDCTTCHSKQDPHRSLFGADCVQCHATMSWAIPEFQHPFPRSTVCAECHQAPPSHYMEHFAMISQTIAGQSQAEVRQCYLCHQTTAWNDIKGVGWYKHH